MITSSLIMTESDIDQQLESKTISIKNVQLYIQYVCMYNVQLCTTHTTYTTTHTKTLTQSHVHIVVVRISDGISTYVVLADTNMFN